MNTCKQCHCKNQCAKEDTHLTWPSVEELTQRVPMPEGYSLEQLEREMIPDLVQCLYEWYPAMKVGELSCYLNEDFYTSEVSLEGEPEKNILVLRIRYGGEPAAVLALERKPHSQILYGSLGVIAPRHRGQKLAHVAPLLLETIGRRMGFGLVYCYVSLRIPQAQAVAEAAGYQLVGILPASDRVMIEGGIKHMYEGIYVKVLANDGDILELQDKSLTPKTKVLVEFLFGTRL